MGNPIKQYCVVYITNGVNWCGPTYNATVCDAESGDVLTIFEHLCVKRDTKEIQDLGETYTGRPCLEVIRR